MKFTDGSRAARKNSHMTKVGGRHVLSSNSTTLSLFYPVMFGKLSIAFIVVSLTALLCAQSAEAAKGPRVTHKVFFDIKHGEESMGRSTYT